MRTLTLLLMLAISLFGQETSIRDTIRSSVDRTLFTGDVLIYPPSGSVGGVTISPIARSIRVTSGLFFARLAPNDQIIPAGGVTTGGTSYRVRYVPAGGDSWSETWVVPTTSATLSIAAVRVATPPPPNTPVSLNQINGGTTDGCPRVVSGVLVVLPCDSASGTIYAKAATAATSLSIPGAEHGLRTAFMVIQCETTSGPIETGLVTINPTTFDTAIQFATPFTGACELRGGPHFSKSMSAASSLSIPASEHLISNIVGVVCSYSDGRFFIMDATLSNSSAFEFNGAWRSGQDVSISFGDAAVSGRCAVIGA